MLACLRLEAHQRVRGGKGGTIGGDRRYPPYRGVETVQDICACVPIPPEANIHMPDDLSTSLPSELELGIPQPNEAQSFDVVQLETRGVTSQFPKQRQGSLFAKELIHFASVLAKLDESGHNDIADEIRHCHSDVAYRRCKGCHTTSRFYNRCEKFWCPICQPRLARERKQAVEWWAKEIKQPKHVVLTIRNFDVLNKAKVTEFKDNFAKLRRRNVWRLVTGGFYRIEVTNESRGWHLHMHVLVDARWVDAKLLAETWGKIVGQEFAIVKVKDARSKDYLAEVTKYVVKGDQLATWQAQQVVDFVTSFTGVRAFGVFGSLYGKRTEWREWIEAIHAGRTKCACGCDDWQILGENEYVWEETVGTVSERAIPPPLVHVASSQCELFNAQ